MDHLGSNIWIGMSAQLVCARYIGTVNVYKQYDWSLEVWSCRRGGPLGEVVFKQGSTVVYFIHNIICITQIDVISDIYA